jgi:hypothetical protein
MVLVKAPIRSRPSDRLVLIFSRGWTDGSDTRHEASCLNEGQVQPQLKTPPL